MPLPTRNAYAPTKAIEWVARCVLSLLLASLLSIALGINTLGVALAEDAGDSGTDTGTITIATTDGNEGMQYDVYKIFTCDVDLKSGSYTEYTASNIEWASEEVGAKVLGAIHIYDKTQSTAGWSAQEAADYIEETISGSYATRVSANGLAENLVKAVIDLNATTTIVADEETILDEGYYLIVSTPSAVTDSKIGTSPILTMLGNGQELKITEKTSVPKITKTVAVGSTSGTSSEADAQIGQELSYKLAGTLPDSIPTFTSFYYEFSDVLPAGIDLTMAGDSFSASDVTVTISNTAQGTSYSPTSGCEVMYEDDTKTLTVVFSNLLETEGNSESSTTAQTIPIDKDCVVSVEYKAALNSDASIGAASGNINRAKLTYSKDPQDPQSTVTSTEATATVYTYDNMYGLRLVKVDKKLELDNDPNTSTLIPGVKFTIQAMTTSEAANAGRYIKNNGSYGDTKLPDTTEDDYNDYVFTTGTDGSFYVSALDAGTYTIHELEPLSGYKSLSADLVLTTEAITDSPGQITVVISELSGGNGDGVDEDGDSVLDKGTRAVYDSESGIITITATNEKIEAALPLPLTGLSGITLVYVVGGAILASSLVVIVSRHVRTKKD